MRVLFRDENTTFLVSCDMYIFVRKPIESVDVSQKTDEICIRFLFCETTDGISDKENYLAMCGVPCHAQKTSDTLKIVRRKNPSAATERESIRIRPTGQSCGQESTNVLYIILGNTRTSEL